MKDDSHYRLDYGEYDSEGHMNHFCSTTCLFFSDCPGRGGFCSFSERRELQPRSPKPSLLQEAGVKYEGGSALTAVPALRIPGSTQERCAECLFWHFPAGRGSTQPWRRKLWELKNNF
ncbi:hypothetical protein J7E73_25695 [Paenibacillus albidus]|uniref:hypothetical protein n=1 Tax=Paenibacillus albidus TaxID=2041023 RepID=UPI001BE90A08|nr:hypothetical protein [Paenibacillus albidus]MBT2292466.1 hypothetical protein [Paenibacillus albidus]